MSRDHRGEPVRFEPYFLRLAIRRKCAECRRQPTSLLKKKNP
jgi:hypothetical protein